MQDSIISAPAPALQSKKPAVGKKFSSKGYQNQQLLDMKITTNKLLEGLYDIA
jgi:hypothetical protein